MRADIGKNVGQDVTGENGYRRGWGAERVVVVNSFEFVRTSQLRLGTPLVDAKLHDARFEIMFLCAIPSSTLHRTLGAAGRREGMGALQGGGMGWSLAVSVNYGGIVLYNSVHRPSCE